MELVIGIATGLAMALIAWVVLRPKEDHVARRLELGPSEQATRNEVLEGSLTQRVIKPFASKMGGYFAHLIPKNAVNSIDRMLVMAGEPISLPLFLGLWSGIVLLGGLALGYIVVMKPNLTLLQFLVMAVAILPLVLLGPLMMLRRRVRSRQKRIVRDLPYALDLLVTCIEAGLGIEAAFGMVTERITGPLAESFGLYLKQVALGRPRRAAFQHVAERSGAPDLLRIAAAVIQAEDMGTTLGDVLRTQAEELREARKQRAQEAGQRAPVLMTIPLFFCFVPAMVSVVIVPSMLTLFNFIGTLGGAK